MDLTNWENHETADFVFQHHCLHVAATIEKENDPYEIISYCLTEWPSKPNNLGQKFTFAQLYQQNITSEQLYLWSAPMDIIEEYQLYLNDRSSSMESKIFYNCTLPRFGPYCQYSFDIYDEFDNLSLNEIIYEYYQQDYNPMNLTCYMHLECNRGTKSMCLDWTEICDGTVDCSNGIDEKDCWQLEYNRCDEHSYRCRNGQCISKIFLRDDTNSRECLDTSDEVLRLFSTPYVSSIVLNGEPTIVNEDHVCSGRYYPGISTKLTSSCLAKRDEILKTLLWLDRPNEISYECWLAVMCRFDIEISINLGHEDFCFTQNLHDIVNQTCPLMINMPAGALVYGHIFFLYTKESFDFPTNQPWLPTFICYNDRSCHDFYPTESLITFNNATCRRPKDFPLIFPNFELTETNRYDVFIQLLYEQLSECNYIDYNQTMDCNNLTMYKCINSPKCIFKDKLCDRIYDCLHGDDERCSPINNSCLLYGLENLFKCTPTDTCLSPLLVNEGSCECLSDEYIGYYYYYDYYNSDSVCDDVYSNLYHSKSYIAFTTICDGFIELSPININGKNQTDETECEYWQCNNIYTRCDGFWNCDDGADELDCDPSPVIKCPSYHHICVSSNTNQFMCLPLNKTNDGITDCIGGIDELNLCRPATARSSVNNFYCIKNSTEYCAQYDDICNRVFRHGMCDQQFCGFEKINPVTDGICNSTYVSNLTDVVNFLCSRLPASRKSQIVYFKLDHLSSLILNNIDQLFDIIVPQPSDPKPVPFKYQPYCHRGLPLQTWSDDNQLKLTTITCLCPPNFYGNQCQYQNQRVSLTLRFQTYSDSRKTLFTIVVLLIDDSDQRLIHSYKKMTYIYIKHCQTKFHLSLLYANRPKLLTNNYSIHIDIYEKLTSDYRGSFLIPMAFAFLPVHRIAVLLNIPRIDDQKKTCSDSNCIHGQCIIYVDDSNETKFCQCSHGWSGKNCSIPYKCTCSSGSICIGIAANNRSICICPLHKWGSQCLLHSTVCGSDQNTTCQNNGQCIPLNENLMPNQQFICLCSKGFSGQFCENEDNKIILSFDQDIELSHNILVHFIRMNEYAAPDNGSTFQTLSNLGRKPMTIYWSNPFHIVFIKLFNDSYYLIHVQKTYNQSSVITKTIHSTDRCSYINEIFNETIVNYHLIRRIKYYHIPCQNSSLSCFYDDRHFCFCYNFNHQRLANCFEFNSTFQYDCFGQSDCQYGGQCLQDRSNCPQTSICICPQCYYGSRCQFSANLFTLSLDSILASHIQPCMNMNCQPTIVKVSVGLVTILVLANLVNGLLSLMTFNKKEIQIVGCGLYLLVTSIMVLFIGILFTFKFTILLIAQMTHVTNRTFLNIQCHSIDFLLQSCLLLEQWLNACVAAERAFTVTKGIKFNQMKSQKVAKYVIIILICFILATNIHDPIYRNLIYTNENDNDENRIWCIVTYSEQLQIYNKVIQTFYFFVPFIVNIISAIIIIIASARQRMILQRNQTYNHLLSEQVIQHKNLLIAPLILIILAVPRLILYFVGGCMKSTKDSWLFVSGYFISFIPSMLTFPVFVLSSTSYKAIFERTVREYRQNIQRRFRSHS